MLPWKHMSYPSFCVPRVGQLNCILESGMPETVLFCPQDLQCLFFNTLPKSSYVGIIFGFIFSYYFVIVSSHYFLLLSNFIGSSYHILSLLMSDQKVGPILFFSSSSVIKHHQMFVSETFLFFHIFSSCPYSGEKTGKGGQYIMYLRC